MKSASIVYLVAALTLTAIGCVPDTEDTGAGDTTVVNPGDSEKTDVRTSTLEQALPVDGAFVTGSFTLEATVSTATDVEIRFLVDGTEVGVVNEFPYALELDACELSIGNHAYIVEMTDASGERDFAEQWFTVEACD